MDIGADQSTFLGPCFGPHWAFANLKALNTYSAAKAAIASLREAFRQASGHAWGTRMDMAALF